MDLFNLVEKKKSYSMEDTFPGQAYNSKKSVHKKIRKLVTSIHLRKP